MKNISAVLTVLMHLNVLLFQFGVIYLGTGQANYPNLHSGHLNFTPGCLFESNIYSTKFSSHQKPASF